jgi:hypothetical protein
MRDTQCVEHPTKPTRAVSPFAVRNALTASSCGSDDLLIAVVLFRAIK